MDNTQLYTEILQRNKKMLSDSTRLGTVRKAKAAGELIQMRPGMTSEHCVSHISIIGAFKIFMHAIRAM